MLEDNLAKLKKIVLIFFTVWRLDFLPKSQSRFFNFLKLLIFPVNTIYGGFCTIWHLFVQIEDYNDIIDVAFTITLIIGFYQCFMIYIMIIVYNKKRILEIFKYFENLVTFRDALTSDVRNKHFERSIGIALMLTRFFLSTTFVSWFVIVIFNLEQTDYACPMFYSTPGIPRESFFFYPVNLIHQGVLFFASYQLIMLSDIVIMIMLICCQAEMETIAELLSKLNDKEVATQGAGMIIRKVYEVHLALAEQTNKLTMSFWHIYLQKLLVIMLYLCSMILAFQDSNDFPLVAFLCVLIIMSQNFILCFFGQMLRDSSDRMAEAVYMTKWYEMGVKDQRAILMLMMRFHHPVKVETFGFGIISLYTFVQIFKASVSYATILYTVLQ